MTGMRIKGREQTAMRGCNCGIRPGVKPGQDSDSGFMASGPNAERKSPTGNGPAPDKGRSHFVSHLLNFIGWIVPTAILALIPKCPACLAGYAVIGTSVAVSLSTFAQMRLALVILCIALLSFLGINSILRVVTRMAAKTRS
jgi:hypothetical protein